MSSFTPRRSQKIPWHVIADHFLLAFPNPRKDRLDFFIRHTSRQPQRQYDLASLAYELAFSIAEKGERIRTTFPKPDASADTWREAVVVDDNLFPEEFLDRLEGLNGSNPSIEPNAHRLKTTWYRAITLEANRAATALVINALAEYPDPGRYLPSLAYLAQQPRVRLNDMGFHYNLPPAHETFLKRNGITSYVDVTIRNYLLLNMLLTLDPSFYSGSPLLRDPSFLNPSTRWELPLPTMSDTFSLDEGPDFVEPLHHSFWTAFSDEHGVEAGLIFVYMDRCLSFLAGWYAIMTESTVKARALKTYFPADFVVKDLATIILLRLRDISLTFEPPSFDTETPVAFMEKWMSELPPPINLEPPVALASSKMSTNEVQGGTSTFMRLPRELRHHILSFLPLPLVVPLASLCRELRETCTDLIFAHPISALQVHRVNALDNNISDPIRERSLRLEKFLPTRPDLCARLRSFNLSAFDAMETAGNVKRRDAQISLFNPVVRSMRGLSEIKLFLPYPSCALCESDPGTYPVQCGQIFPSVLRVLIGQWPHLRSLTIGHLDKSLTRHPNHDFKSDIEPSLSVEAVPDAELRWNLSELTVQRPRAFDWGTGLEETPAKHVPLRHLINTSAHSLRYLSISSISDEMADVESFPICPAVTHLAIYSELTGGTVTRLLTRCFPAVRFLKASYKDREFWPEDASDISSIDYPRCVPKLEELSYYMYSLKALPSSTKTVILKHEWDTIEDEIHTFENVEAVYLSAAFKEDEHIRRLSLSFPKISSLEVHVTPYRERDMVHLANSLATHLPHLKQFVIEISDFIRAGRRLDYPVDDGMEPVQQECAVMFFRTCPALEILSFNGIPDDWEYECRFPSRVWVKTVEDGIVGARMAGRSALKWKVSEDGDHRHGWYL